MVFNTISVGTAVTPTVIETYFSHVCGEHKLQLEVGSLLVTIVSQSKTPSPETYCPYLIP